MKCPQNRNHKKEVYIFFKRVLELPENRGNDAVKVINRCLLVEVVIMQQKKQKELCRFCEGEPDLCLKCFLKNSSKTINK